MDRILNALIFLITLVLVGRCFRRDGAWSFANARTAFRFFTVQSNVLCAASALLMAILPGPTWVWLFKYVGTVAVTVTMVTVLVFLGPAYGYRPLLSGGDLFMHLITPLLALFSFCVLERRGLSLPQALLGLIPTALYGLLYGWKVLGAPPHRAWEDFYGFNKGGKWPASVAAMVGGTFLICMILMGLQSL